MAIVGPIIVENTVFHSDTCQLTPDSSCTIYLTSASSTIKTFTIQRTSGTNVSPTYWYCSNSGTGGSLFYGQLPDTYAYGTGDTQVYTNLDIQCGQTFSIFSTTEYINSTLVWTDPISLKATSTQITYYDFSLVSMWIIFFLAIIAFSGFAKFFFKKLS